MSKLLTSIMGKRRVDTAGTWDVQVALRSCDSIPLKYKKLRFELRESKGRKASVSDEVAVVNGQAQLPRGSLAIWQSSCTLDVDTALAADRDDLSAGSGSTSTRAQGSCAVESKFFRLALLRIHHSRAVRVRQKCIGSTLIDIAQYVSQDSHGSTRTDTVTLLLSIQNSPPAKVELEIKTTCISASLSASPHPVSEPPSHPKSNASSSHDEETDEDIEHSLVSVRGEPEIKRGLFSSRPAAARANASVKSVQCVYNQRSALAAGSLATSSSDARNALLSQSKRRREIGLPERGGIEEGEGWDKEGGERASERMRNRE